MSRMIRRANPFEWSPVREVMNLIDSDDFPLNRMMDEAGSSSLPVDISEKEGEYIVRASMPGFKKEDIDIQIHEGVLTIRADHVEEEEHQDEKFYRRERRVGSVSRRVSLPGVDSTADARAEFKDGVLTLHIPQSQERRPKKVSIE